MAFSCNWTPEKTRNLLKKFSHIVDVSERVKSAYSEMLRNFHSPLASHNFKLGILTSLANDLKKHTTCVVETLLGSIQLENDVRSNIRVLELIGCIITNVKSDVGQDDYASSFVKYGIIEKFCEVVQQANEDERESIRKIKLSWKGHFTPEVLLEIENWSQIELFDKSLGTQAANPYEDYVSSSTDRCSLPAMDSNSSSQIRQNIGKSDWSLEPKIVSVYSTASQVEKQTDNEPHLRKGFPPINNPTHKVQSTNEKFQEQIVTTGEQNVSTQETLWKHLRSNLPRPHFPLNPDLPLSIDQKIVHRHLNSSSLQTQGLKRNNSSQFSTLTQSHHTNFNIKHKSHEASISNPANVPNSKEGKPTNCKLHLKPIIKTNSNFKRKAGRKGKKMEDANQLETFIPLPLQHMQSVVSMNDFVGEIRHRKQLKRFSEFRRSQNEGNQANEGAEPEKVRYQKPSVNTVSKSFSYANVQIGSNKICRLGSNNQLSENETSSLELESQALPKSMITTPANGLPSSDVFQQCSPENSRCIEPQLLLNNMNTNSIRICQNIFESTELEEETTNLQSNDEMSGNEQLPPSDESESLNLEDCKFFAVPLQKDLAAETSYFHEDPLGNSVLESENLNSELKEGTKCSTVSNEEMPSGDAPQVLDSDGCKTSVGPLPKSVAAEPPQFCEVFVGHSVHMDEVMNLQLQDQTKTTNNEELPSRDVLQTLGSQDYKVFAVPLQNHLSGEPAHPDLENETCLEPNDLSIFVANSNEEPSSSDILDVEDCKHFAAPLQNPLTVEPSQLYQGIVGNSVLEYETVSVDFKDERNFFTDSNESHNQCEVLDSKGCRLFTFPLQNHLSTESVHFYQGQVENPVLEDKTTSLQLHYQSNIADPDETTQNKEAGQILGLEYSGSTVASMQNRLHAKTPYSYEVLDQNPVTTTMTKTKPKSKPKPPLVQRLYGTDKKIKKGFQDLLARRNGQLPQKNTCPSKNSLPTTTRY